MWCCNPCDALLTLEDDVPRHGMMRRCADMLKEEGRGEMGGGRSRGIFDLFIRSVAANILYESLCLCFVYNYKFEGL